MPPVAPGKLVVVTWHDIVSHAAWDVEEPADMHASVCYTVGWITHADDRRIVLASSCGDEKGCGGSWVIPTGCIERMEELTNA